VNDKLLELKRKKLQRQILYLRTELEETTFIFQDCLVEFDGEFRDYFKDQSNKDHKKVTTDPPEFDIPKEDVKNVFKKIAQKTHPDKLIKEDTSTSTYKEKVDMYKEALGSVENRDWSRVIEIAMELGIDVSDVKNDDSDYLNESIKALTSKTKELQNTYAWIWYHAENKENAKQMILQSLGLNKEKENGNKK
jgi:hypothetical protein